MAKKTKKKSAAKKKAASRPAAPKATRRKAKASGPDPVDVQEEAYAKALDLFNKGRFQQALKRLEEVEEGPEAGLRHRAGVYINICRQRLESGKPRLKTPEDHYNYAVQLINDRELDDAEQHLNKALKANKKAGHVYYALALVAALREDAEAAYQNLAMAVQADPRYRIQAKVDSDLAAVVSDPQIAELLSADDESSGG